MKFLTLTLAAVLTLAFSFTATPAEAGLEPLAKCRVYNAKIKMNYAKCLELDNLLVEKGKAAKGICESKRTTSLEKATAKFVTKLGVDAADCGIDTATTEADQALQLLASSDQPLTPEQEAALAGTAADITSDNAEIAATAAQATCSEANGTWDGSVCTPAAVPDRDCFREGACGVDGWNDGAYVGVTSSSTGCSDTSAGTDSYTKGVAFCWGSGWCPHPSGTSGAMCV